jgi:hypothetical protein
MRSDVLAYLIAGHEKVIAHYRRVLALPGLTPAEATAIRGRILCYQAELDLLQASSTTLQAA